MRSPSLSVLALVVVCACEVNDDNDPHRSEGTTTTGGPLEDTTGQDFDTTTGDPFDTGTTDGNEDSTGTGDDDDDAQCGNGVREGSEACDDMDFGDAMCPEGMGVLACSDDCTLDESQCGIMAVEGDYLCADDDAQMQSLTLEDGVPEDIDQPSFNAFAYALTGAPGEGYMLVGGRFEASGNPPFVAFAAEDRVFANVSPPDGFSAEETLVDVAYGDGTWVAIGRDGSIRTDDHGMTWAHSPDPADLGFREELAYGDGAFVLARGDYSTDSGATWSIAAEPPFNGAANGAAIGFGEGRFVAVGRDGPSGLGGSPYSCISEDAGESWSCYLLPFAQVGSLSTTAAVVHGDGRWVFGGQHVPYILLFSDDGGETWTTADFPIVDDDAMISDITYKPEVGFLATVDVGFADSAILHSVDGATWTQVGDVVTETRYVGAASIP